MRELSLYQLWRFMVLAFEVLIRVCKLLLFYFQMFVYKLRIHNISSYTTFYIDCTIFPFLWQSPEPLFSSAQIAIIRVFARCVEVSSEMGSLSGVEMEKTITARLLVASNEVSCLLDAEGKISFDIRTATGVQMQLLVGTLDETCATDYDDYVLEVCHFTNSLFSY